MYSEHDFSIYQAGELPNNIEYYRIDSLGNIITENSPENYFEIISQDDNNVLKFHYEDIAGEKRGYLISPFFFEHKSYYTMYFLNPFSFDSFPSVIDFDLFIGIGFEGKILIARIENSTFGIDFIVLEKDELIETEVFRVSFEKSKLVSLNSISLVYDSKIFFLFNGMEVFNTEAYSNFDNKFYCAVKMLAGQTYGLITKIERQILKQSHDRNYIEFPTQEFDLPPQEPDFFPIAINDLLQRKIVLPKSKDSFIFTQDHEGIGYCVEKGNVVRAVNNNNINAGYHTCKVVFNGKSNT